MSKISSFVPETKKDIFIDLPPTSSDNYIKELIASSTAYRPQPDNMDTFASCLEIVVAAFDISEPISILGDFNIDMLNNQNQI